MTAMPADTYFLHLAERLVEFVEQSRARQLAEAGLSDLAPSHGGILLLLARHRRLTVTEIAKGIHRKKPTVTILLRRLEQRGLIQRIESETDRRVVWIELSAEGRRFRRRMIAGFEQLQRQFAAPLTRREQETLTALLKKSIGPYVEQEKGEGS